MKAGLITSASDPAKSIEIRDVDVPEPGPDEVRIEVKACGITRADVLMRQNFDEMTDGKPLQTGSEIAGVIDAVGGATSEFEVSDRVNVYHRKTCGTCEWCLAGEETMCEDNRKIGRDIPGGFAEYIVVPAESVDPIPDSMDFVTAGAYPSSFTTAWRMIVTTGELRPSERALILGASGGVGHACLQLSERLGAETYATTSTQKKAERVSEWAEAVINYEDVDFAEEIRALTDERGVDLVADHVGQATWQQSIDSLAKGGRMVVCGATSGPYPDINIRSLYQHHRQIRGAPLGNRRDFRNVGRLIARGEVGPEIDRTLPLDRLADAHLALENRDVTGKVVVMP